MCCFLVSILFELQSKNSKLLQDYYETNRVDLTETLNKYKTKLGHDGEDQPQSPNCPQQIQLTLKFSK